MKNKIAGVFRNLYRMIPGKQLAFEGLRVFWSPPAKVYKHLSFKGRFRVPVELGSFQMQHYGFELENCIFWSGVTGDWEGQSIKIWIELTRHFEVIYDVGANTGVFSLIAKTVNPMAEVHAFEPVERVFERLSLNNKINDFNIRCVRWAASDRDGKAIIFDQNSEHIYSVTVNQDLSLPGTHTVQREISTKRLDTYFAALPLNTRPPQLLKIDVETHEPEVLLGMGNLLTAHRPDMLIEILNNDIAIRIENLVGRLGYLYFNLGEKGSIHRQEHLSKSDSYNFLVCKPETARKLGLTF